MQFVVITARKLYALIPRRLKFWEITQSPFLQPLASWLFLLFLLSGSFCNPTMMILVISVKSQSNNDACCNRIGNTIGFNI